MAREKKITVDGKTITVRDRDFYLWTQYNRGLLTRAEVAAFQAEIPEDTSTHKTSQAVEGARAVGGGEGVATRSVVAPETGTDVDITGADPLPGPDNGIIVGMNLLEAGLITNDEFRDLVVITRPDETPETIAGMAMEAYGITANEMAAVSSKLTTFDVDKAKETSRSAGMGQSRRRDWASQVTGGFERGLGKIGGAIGEHFSESEKSKARMALRQGMEENLDAIIASGDITRSEAEKMIGRLGNPMSDEMLADYAGRVTEFIDLENVDPTAVATLTALTGGIETALTPEGDRVAEPAPGQLPSVLEPEEQRRISAQYGGIRRDVLPDLPTTGPVTLAEYQARTDLLLPEQQQEAAALGRGAIFEQATPGISHPLSAWGEVPGEFWYDKAAGEIYSQERYQAILDGASKVASGYSMDSDTAAYFEANESPRSWEAERAEKTFQSFNVSMRASMFGDQDTSLGVRTPEALLDRPWEAQGFDWQPGAARAYWDRQSPEQKRQLERQVTNNGLLDSYLDGKPYATGVGTSPFTDSPMLMIGVLDQALGVSRGEQISPQMAIGRLGGYVQQVRDWQSATLAATRAATAAAAPQREPFRVPQSLRYIPDKREIAQDTKATFEAKLGRKALPGELEELSNELTGFHRRKQQQMIDQAYAWYEGADSPDDFDLTETITDPSKVLAEEVEQKWAAEINLNERQERQSDSFGRIMRATGGNLGSMGSTPATGGENVVRI
jgi:hypothetical protein